MKKTNIHIYIYNVCIHYYDRLVLESLFLLMDEFTIKNQAGVSTPPYVYTYHHKFS